MIVLGILLTAMSVILLGLPLTIFMILVVFGLEWLNQ